MAKTTKKAPATAKANPKADSGLYYLNRARLKGYLTLKDCSVEFKSGLNIIIGNETKKIELDNGFYSLDDLVEGISENLEDVNIVCKRDKKGRVIIENTESDDFIIDCSEDSFGKYFALPEFS